MNEQMEQLNVKTKHQPEKGAPTTAAAPAKKKRAFALLINPNV